MRAHAVWSPRSARSRVFNFIILTILASLPAFTIGCGGGSPATSSSKGTAPSNLTYPQTSISATVGVAISTDTPSVSGTVSSFGVSPVLPTGLSLNATTGVVSGTPTAQSAGASYTITASNSAGSTTATVQISVSPAVTAPSNLTYPQTSLTLEVGQPFASDIPSFAGTVTSFSISPALPAGLSFDVNSGTIYGVATVSASSNTYTVAASNAGGSTTASITLSVNPALVTLLNLGSTGSISTILTAGSNVLTLDSLGHWELVGYSSGTELASGDEGLMGEPPTPIETAGSIFAVTVTNGLEVRSTTDGHLLSIISFPMAGQTISYGTDPAMLIPTGWWQIASDGSYICAGSSAGLTAWSTSGAILMSRTGNYSTANAFAAPGQILVAQGAAGQNVIETVSVASGSSTVGPAFSGTFNTWFTDGTYFLTSLNSNVWTYNTSSTETSFFANIPAFTSLGGQGNWWWTVSSSGLTIYPLGSSTAAGSYPVGGSSIIPSGSTIGLLGFSSGSPTLETLDLIDLSGTSLAETTYTLPGVYTLPWTTYGAFSASQWVLGTGYGSVIDGASLSSTLRYLSQGTALDIAGSNGTVAVAAANGNVYVFDPSNTTPLETISFPSTEVALSADGTVLAAGMVERSPAQSAETLNVYALPASTVTNSWSYPSGGNTLLGFSLATSGSNIGMFTGNSNTGQYQREVTAVTGGAAIWSDTIDGGAPVLSPDGDYIAANVGPDGYEASSNFYQNGTVLTAVSGTAVGWIDETHVLVDNFSTDPYDFSYLGCTIYSPGGTPDSSPSLPEIQSFQNVSAGLIYVPASNTIYSTSSSGSATWTSNYPSGGVGATAGGDVVFLSGARVVVQSQ